jgi:hypothetical protein
MAELNFNAAQVAPDMGMEPIPEGWYNLMVDQSELKPTKDNATTGNAFLELRFNIVDGQYVGRKLFSRFNIRNANPTAQEIGYKQLSAVAHAVGVLMVQQSEQLHGIPLKGKVKIRPAQKEADGSVKYEASNEITTYKNINEPTPGPIGAPGNAPGAPAGGFPSFAPPPAGTFAPPPFAAPAAAPVAPPAFTAPPAFVPPAVAAPVAAPVAPPAFVPPVVTPPAPAPVAPVVAAFPPEGWTQHPQSPAHFYKGAEVLTEAELRAKMAPPPAAPPVAPPTFAPPVAPAVPAAPAVPGAPNPGAAQSLTPPWARPAA